MTVLVDRDMERAFGQLYEIQRRLLNGALSPLAIRSPLQEIMEGKLATVTDGDSCSKYLLGLKEQLACIRGYNETIWKRHLTAEQLDAVDTTSTHVQRVNDLEILHVDFGPLEETARMWWQAIAAEYYYYTEQQHLPLLGKKNLRLVLNTQGYEPGVHRIRINLLAYSDSEELRTIDELRTQAHADGETLCAAECLSAYGLHTQLVRQQYGTTLPYAHMAGFAYKRLSQGLLPERTDWRSTLVLGYKRGVRTIELGYASIDYPAKHTALPVLVKS